MGNVSILRVATTPPFVSTPLVAVDHEPVVSPQSLAVFATSSISRLACPPLHLGVVGISLGLGAVVTGIASAVSLVPYLQIDHLCH